MFCCRQSCSSLSCEDQCSAASINSVHAVMRISVQCTFAVQHQQHSCTAKATCHALLHVLTGFQSSAACAGNHVHIGDLHICCARSVRVNLRCQSRQVQAPFRSSRRWTELPLRDSFCNARQPSIALKRTHLDRWRVADGARRQGVSLS